MPRDDSDVREALNDPSLQVDRGDPRPRPMIAILDARPGMAGPLREVVAGLARQVRREPGCLTFTARDLRLAARVRRQQAAGEQTPDGCRAGLLEQARPPR